MRPIRPELLRRWKAFREQQTREWGKQNPPYRDSGRVEMPNNFGHLRAFRVHPAPALHWKGGEKAVWSDETFTYVATKENDDHGDMEFIGEFTDRPNEAPSRGHTWKELLSTPVDPETGTRKHARASRLLKGPDHRHAWRVGILDRNHGDADKDRRRFRYAVLADFSYDDLRKHFWLHGYSKHEADILARREFESRQQRLEAFGEGQLGFVGVVVKVFLLDDEDDDRLAQESTWGIESDSDDEYFDEIARELAEEARGGAIETLRRRIERYQLVLPGLEAL